MKPHAARLARFALLGLLVAFAAPRNAGADPTPPAPVGSAAASAAAAATIANFAYDPATLTVAAGTRVTFRNADNIAHTVTAVDTGSDAKPVFDSGDIGQNGAWAFTFAKAGTYRYYCAYHTYMKGTIIVK